MDQMGLVEGVGRFAIHPASIALQGPEGDPTSPCQKAFQPLLVAGTSALVKCQAGVQPLLMLRVPATGPQVMCLLLMREAVAVLLLLTLQGVEGRAKAVQGLMCALPLMVL